jgi:hypothetical protein
VWETATRQECYTVRRPVYETAYRTECQTVMQPVTSYRTEYVDQGCYVEQIVMKPGLPKSRLRWASGSSTLDPMTGAVVYNPPGLYWEQTPRGRYEVQRVWQPNPVAVQVPQTSYVPQTVSRQVPVQVCRYVEEQVVRDVPYQVCRIVREEQVRKVPYTVCRQVVERVEQQVPVQVCRMVTEEQTREVPVTTCRMVYEDRVEQVPYRVCRMEAVQETVQVPRCVEKRIPVTYTTYVPRVVCCRVPIDACGVPLGSCLPLTAVPAAAAKQPTPAGDRQAPGSRGAGQPGPRPACLHRDGRPLDPPDRRRHYGWVPRQRRGFSVPRSSHYGSGSQPCLSRRRTLPGISPGVSASRPGGSPALRAGSTSSESTPTTTTASCCRWR